MELMYQLQSLDFKWPYAVVLAVLPILRYYAQKRKEQDAPAPYIPAYLVTQASNPAFAAATAQGSRWKKSLNYLLWLLLVIAAMRPTLQGPAIELPLEGRDLMLAIDISPSMKEVDMPLNGRTATRLQVVKSVVSEFIQQRQGDRIGLILFGSEPYVQAPLTFDTKTVNTLLDEAFLGMAGQSTAIGDAIALSVKRLRERPEQSRVLILMSDGANTAGEIPPEKSAQLAADERVKIYTIGIGADEMLQRSLFGTRRINPSAELDEAMLTNLADTTGGRYFRARSMEELNQIYEEIDAFEPIESESRSYHPERALSFYFILASLGIFSFTRLVRILPNKMQSEVRNV